MFFFFYHNGIKNATSNWKFQWNKIKLFIKVTLFRTSLIFAHPFSRKFYFATFFKSRKFSLAKISDNKVTTAYFNFLLNFLFPFIGKFREKMLYWWRTSRSHTSKKIENRRPFRRNWRRRHTGSEPRKSTNIFNPTAAEGKSVKTKSSRVHDFSPCKTTLFTVKCVFKGCNIYARMSLPCLWNSS